MSDKYTFGDSDRAAERLALLAEVFRPTTETFLRARGPAAPSLAVDLGAGPGHTTALLAEVLGPARTVAIERSPAFAARARAHLGAHLGPGAEVLQADVRALPTGCATPT